MTVKTDDLAYQIANLRTGGSGPFQPHVRVYCGNCTNRLEFPCANSRPPEHIAKAVRHKGWEFELHNRRRSRCPECIKLHAATRQGESPGAKRLIELFGRKVELPVNIIPEDARTLPPEPAPTPPAPRPAPPPPPAPVREIVKAEPKPLVVQEKRPKPQPQPQPQPQLPLIMPPSQFMQVVREYRIELRTDRSLVDLASALSALGEVTALVVTKTEHVEQHVARALPPPEPTQEPKVRYPNRGHHGPKSDSHRLAIQTALRAKAAAHMAKVRNAIDEIRRTAPNGRAPAIHEYIRELNAMGLKPYSRSVWSEANVRSHLAALDNA